MNKEVRANAPFVFILLPFLLLFVPGMRGFAYPAGGVYSDMAVTHFPYALALRRAILSGEFPLWSEHIFARAPLAANPLANVFYPPQYLALLFPLPFGLNLTALAHVLFGVFGVLAYARARGFSRESALLGMLAFSLLPKVFAFWSAGFLSYVYAFSWTPWLLTLVHFESRRWYQSPALILALIFLADPRYAVYATLLYIAYSYFFESTSQRDWAGGLARTAGFAFGWAAPLLLPMSLFTLHATRVGLQPEETQLLALEAGQLLGLLFPFAAANHELQGYAGLALLSLALAGACFLRSRHTHFWSAVLLVSILLALGSNVPGGAWLSRVLSPSLLRVPSRILIVSSLAVVLLALEAVEVYLSRSDDADKSKIRLWFVGWVSFSGLLSAGVFFLAREISNAFFWSSAIVMVVWIVFELLWAGRLTRRTAAILLLVVIGLDLGKLDASLLAYRPRQSVLSEGGDAARFLAEQPGEFRVYSPSYSLPQQTAAWFRLSRVDGVDPLQLSAFAGFMDQATGVPRAGYSVTIPPLEGEDVASVNAAYTPDIQRLGQLDVRYIISAFPLAIDAPVVYDEGETLIYQLPPSETQVIFDLPYYSASIVLGLGIWAITTIAHIRMRQRGV